MARIILLGMVFFCLVGAATCWAVPETVGVRVTDVTPRSFCLVWMSNVAVEPDVEVYADAGMTEELTSEVRVEAFPDAGVTVHEAAAAKHIYRLRVAGLQAGHRYHVRSVSRDAADDTSIGYSALLEVVTANQVAPFYANDEGTLVPLNNDLLHFGIYIRPQDQDADLAGYGDLLILEGSAFAAPLSAFSSAAVDSGSGIIDLNNLFDLSGNSAGISGGETVTLRVYRGGTLSVLYHLRQLPAANGTLALSVAQKGFNAADLNVDGKVDNSDFELFKEHYRQQADATDFNPDMNFIAIEDTGISAADRIDLQDFGWFAGQYGLQKAD